MTRPPEVPVIVTPEALGRAARRLEELATADGMSKELFRLCLIAQVGSVLRGVSAEPWMPPETRNQFEQASQLLMSIAAPAIGRAEPKPSGKPPDSWPIPDANCPTCGEKFNRGTTVIGPSTRAFQPGDLAICVGCHEFLVFTDAVSPRKLSHAEFLQLDQKTQDHMLRARNLPITPTRSAAAS